MALAGVREASTHDTVRASEPLRQVAIREHLMKPKLPKLAVASVESFLRQSEQARVQMQAMLDQARADGHEVIGDMIIVRSGQDAVNKVTVK
jgi:hypothetical protein